MTAGVDLSVWRAIFKFYFSHVRSFDRIHPNVLSGKMFPPGPDDMGLWTFDASFKREFEANYNSLKEVIKKCKIYRSYDTIFWASIGIRVLMSIAALVRPWWTLPIGLLQFVVAPLSFPFCVLRTFTYLPPAACHYVFSALLGPVLGGYGFVVTVDLWFILFFLTMDQIHNFLVYWFCSEPFPTKKLIHHIVFGSVNTRLYYVAVFGCLQGLQIDLLLGLLVSVLTLVVERYLMARIFLALRLPCYYVMYYVEHRIGHLPDVYPQGHKMHHHMHDATPWDAHFTGGGMNEQYGWMLLEIIPCLLAPRFLWISPFCLNSYFFEIAWYNKPGHTRSKEGSALFDPENFHADHHTLHTKNFALCASAMLDFYFDTMGPNAWAANGIAYKREAALDKDGTESKIMIHISPSGKKRV